MKRTTTIPRSRILTASVGMLMSVAVLSGCSNAVYHPGPPASAIPAPDTAISHSPTPTETQGSPASATPTQSPAISQPPTTTGSPEINPPGDIPDNQAFVPFTPQGQTFTVSVPEGWARTGTPTLTTFTDKLNSVTVEAKQAAKSPTVASVTSTEMPKVQASVSGYQAGETTDVTRNSGPVILTTYKADSAPNPVTGKSVHDEVQRYVYYKRGTEVVLTLSGAPVSDDTAEARTAGDHQGVAS